MEVDVAAQRSIILQHRPAATRYGIGLVETLPRALDMRLFMARRLSPVEPGLNSDEPEAATVIRVELDEPWSNEVYVVLVPEIHLHDAPPARVSCHAVSRLVIAPHRRDGS